MVWWVGSVGDESWWMRRRGGKRRDEMWLGLEKGGGGVTGQV